MRKFLLLLTVCLLSIPLIFVFFIVQAIEDKPNISRQVIITPEYVARAKQIIETHRHQFNPKNLVTIRILSSDADITANYLAHRFANGSAQVITADRSALVRFSLPIPTHLFNGYLNFEFSLIQTTGLPQLHEVRIGKLHLPDFITTSLVSQFSKWVQSNPELRLGVDVIKQVKISPNKINVTYQHWLAGLTQQKNSIPLISKKIRTQLLRYHTLLANNSRLSNATHVMLSEILMPLMHLASTYSKNNNASAENRAVILVTTFYVLGISIKNLVPEASSWPVLIKQAVTIDGRKDFAKHFMVSAAIAAYADTILADAIGLYKEIEDSHSGSGFSFNDMAANRAGTKFAEQATANQASAKQIQQRMMYNLKDSDLMPPWMDLPEHMPEAEFKIRFGGVNTPAYQQMMREIEKRVSMLSILN